MTPHAHFARIEPVVGSDLRHACVAVLGLPLAAPLVELLAACGVGRWLWSAACRPLHSELRARHGAALGLDVLVAPPDSWRAALRSNPPDLLLAAGEPDALYQALEIAGSVAAVLLIAPPLAAAPCRALCVLPGDDRRSAMSWIDEVRWTDEVAPVTRAELPAVWPWRTAVPLLAGLARALLLRGTRYARQDLETLWAQGARAVTLGGAHPFDIAWELAGSAAVPHCDATPPFETPTSPRGALLIAGLGSLGSVAATHLARFAQALVLADQECVDVYNPVRQAYSQADIGRPKARALRDRLAGAGCTQVVALDEALRDERQVEQLVARHNVTAALVVTGTQADFAIARALRVLDLPHLVGRCYPRARYWEAIVVDGIRGSSLADMRGHIAAGPAAPLTPEQRAAYSDAGALEAEPATLVESGWAAAWMARLTAQLLAPLGLRERWFLELLADRRTCIVGGVGVEPTGQGPAYGVALPGQIHAWGHGQVSSYTSADVRVGRSAGLSPRESGAR